MYKFRRLLTALVVFLSGAVLIPFVSLPAQAFSWELFADAYESEPTLIIDHDEGKPGSSFEIKGKNFPPNATATITINGTVLGTIMTDGDGKFEIELNTTGADDGAYFVTASVNPTATIRFALDSSSPNTWPSPGVATVFPVPSGIAFTQSLYLPIILR
ncbi:MAG: hypothetical protein Kow0031_06180 [Anaerolineae bacterium]